MRIIVHIDVQTVEVGGNDSVSVSQGGGRKLRVLVT
jgi:hypothetical protein